MSSIRRFSYGVKKLDDALQGGIPQYFMVLHVGVPGTFKTISALRWAIEQAKFSKPTIYITTEQAMDDIIEQGSQIYGEFVKLLEENKLVIISELNSYLILGNETIDTTLRSPTIQGLRKSINFVMKTLRWRNVEAIVIDSVSTFWANAPAKARQMAIDLKKMIVNELGATSIVISQTSSLTGQSFGWAIEFVADGILRFERKEPRVGSEAEIEYYVLVEKMRLTNHTKKWIRLEFNDFTDVVQF